MQKPRGETEIGQDDPVLQISGFLSTDRTLGLVFGLVLIHGLIGYQQIPWYEALTVGLALAFRFTRSMTI